MIDLYSNYHLTYRITSLEENIAYQISQFARSYLPTYRTNFSPFEPSTRSQVATAAVPNASKNPSSIDSNSSTDDDSDTSSDEDDTHSSLKLSLPEQRQLEKKTISSEIKSHDCKSVYGFELESPDKQSMAKYKAYVHFQKKLQPSEKNDKKSKPIVLESSVIFRDSAEKVTEPVVSDEDKKKYENYCNLIINPDYDENYKKDDIIEKYINFTFNM
jgi:hypothetical protein